MEEIDNVHRLLRIKDDDVKHPYNTNAFVGKLNKLCEFFDAKNSTPHSAYLNCFVETVETYNDFVRNVNKLLKQTKYLMGKLKVSGQYVYMPDIESFVAGFEKCRTFDDIKKEANSCLNTVKTCVNENERIAGNYGIKELYPDKVNEKK